MRAVQRAAARARRGEGPCFNFRGAPCRFAKEYPHVCARCRISGLQLPSPEGPAAASTTKPPTTEFLLAPWPPFLKCASASRTKGKKLRRTPRRRRQPRSRLHEAPPPPPLPLRNSRDFSPHGTCRVHWISTLPLVNSKATCPCAPALLPDCIALQEASKARQGDNRPPHGQPRRPSPSLQRLPPHKVQRCHPHPTIHFRAAHGGHPTETCKPIWPWGRRGLQRVLQLGVLSRLFSMPETLVVCPNRQAKWLTRSVSIFSSQGGDTRGTTCTC